LKALTRTAAGAGDSLYEPRSFIDGHEAQRAFGLQPGRLLGRLIDALVDAQVDGSITTREEALEWGRRWLETSGPDDDSSE
jgi:hypothetical protein